MARCRSCSLKAGPHRPTAGCGPRPNGLQCCLSAKTRGRLDSSMSLIRCSNCAHDNPADSKFCAACGGALHLPAYLASCPRCGTVNPVKATICCWCQGPLAGRRQSRRPSPVVVGTAVLAAVAALGYYTYPQLSLVLARQPPAAGAETSAGPASPAATLLETSPPETAPADPARAAANQPPPGRQPVEAAIKRPQATGAGNAGGQEPPCTEAVAALGLCTPKPTQRRE